MPNSDIPLLSYNDALQQILNTVSSIKEMENIPLHHAHSRFLAESILSPIDLPVFNNSAMDGYAVRLSDLKKSDTLPVASALFAGQSDDVLWPIGTCLRVMTGCHLPDEVDAVVMQENVTVTDDGVIFPYIPKEKENIRFAGEEFALGQLVIEAGEKLTTKKLIMIAALGIDNVSVFKKPKIALFSTGNELAEMGQPLAANQIYDSNRFALELMLTQLGCEVINLGIVCDDPKEIESTFEQADEIADLVISSGGVSVGDADFTRQILTEKYSVHLWKIAMKPGKPFAFGKLNRSWFCGLPGNPVSAMITFYHLVQPLILKLAGKPYPVSAFSFKVKTSSPLKKRPGRLDFQRGTYSINATGELEVSVDTSQQHSHYLSSLGNNNCFIILEKERGDVEVGEFVNVHFFNSILN